MGNSDFRNKKLNYFNPLEPGADDISFDITDMQDPRSAIMLKNEAMDNYTRRNVFKGVNEYIGMVLTKPILVQKNSGHATTLGSWGVTAQKKIFKIHIPVLHAAIGNPCDIGYLSRISDFNDIFSETPSSKINQAVAQRIMNHPWFVADVGGWFGTQEPTIGSLVRVKFAKGPSSGRAEEGIVISIEMENNVDSIKNTCNNLLAIFDNTVPSTLGGMSTTEVLDAALQRLGDRPAQTIPTGEIGAALDKECIAIGAPTTNKDFFVGDVGNLDLAETIFKKSLFIMAKQFYCVTSKAGKARRVNLGRVKTDYQTQKDLFDNYTKCVEDAGTPFNPADGCNGVYTPADPGTEADFDRKAANPDTLGHSNGTAVDCGTGWGGAPDIVEQLSDLSPYGLIWGGQFATPDIVHIQKSRN